MGIETGKDTADGEKNHGTAPELNELVELARDKSSQSRARLATVIGDLYTGEERLLSDVDRQIMSDIIHQLIQEVELSVRKALAERLSTIPNAHSNLLNMLANDDIEVAHPILVHSEVMRDSELIEIVQFRTMEHQVAVAMRPTLSEPLSNALIKTGNQRVITALLENAGASIAEDDLRALVEQSREVASYQTPLTQRRDLPPALARKLFWSVSAALRDHLLANYDLDPSDLDENIVTAVRGLLEEDADEDSDASRAFDNIAPVMATTNDFVIHPDQATWLLGLLKEGEIPSFLLGLSRFSQLRVNLLRRILFEPGGEGLAIVCQALGLDKPAFASILVQFRHGRLGDKNIETDEITQAMAFFDNTTRENATALLRRWQRDPEYQNAMRIVSDAKPASG
ncbi:DUF2336 domain-containing protein [Pelagibius sp. Alg239-R121]|uniref:DUF2336 domain-containing protein n=1 Tax=Pelagibius sp. Alg239-R121 TaxID=2993448 RepID=UPI0024A669F5|nr:DUF2336 domain-containing protein [Pelagibius sp. Alg239-R121]